MGTTKRFNLTWNNAKIPNLSIESRFRERTAEGIQFSTGYVALSNGVMFESLTEMEHHLQPYGKFEVTFADEKHDEQAKESDHAQTA